MADKLEGAIGFNRQALSLRDTRQQVLANNIANADTPNFKARDFDFASELKKATGSSMSRSGGLDASRTSSRHLEARTSGMSHVDLDYRVPDQPSLDGNTVDMDRERAQFMDNSVRYQASITFMNSTLQSLKSAMQSEQ